MSRVRLTYEVIIYLSNPNKRIISLQLHLELNDSFDLIIFTRKLTSQPNLYLVPKCKMT